MYSDVQENLIQEATDEPSLTIEEMVNDNINLVYYVRNKYFKSYNEDEDIFQEGMIGLFKATKAFKSNIGYTFSTFACKVIQNEMLQYIRKNSKAVKYGVNTISLDDNIQCDRIDYSENQEYTLSSILSRDDINYDYVELDIRNLFENLTDKERQCVYYTYLGYNQTQIGERMQIAQSYVSRILKSGLSKIRKELTC